MMCFGILWTAPAECLQEAKRLLIRALLKSEVKLASN
jgi:hypothetical protein